MQGGARYQNRAAAWFAVQILAEADLPWDLPEGVVAESINCETTGSVDDILVGTSAGGTIYIQAKTKLLWNSELLSALKQCVRQYLDPLRGGGTKARLDAMRDRLVLISGPNSSEPIRIHLPKILARLRGPVSAIERVRDAAINKAEREVLAKLRRDMAAIWREVNCGHLAESEMRSICSLLHVHVLDVDGDGEQARGALSDLQKSVVLKRDQAQRAWTEIVAECTDLAVLRSGTDRECLRQKLQAKQIALQGVPSYRDDVKALTDLTQREMQRLAMHGGIICGGKRVQINRTCSVILQREASDANVVVVGDPGSGKSGVLSAFITNLRDQRADFVLIAADDISATSFGSLRVELSLQHDILDVMKAWSGTAPAYLIIDALDAAQTAPSQGVLHRLIEQATALKGRWRVVLTIRKWDLRKNPGLQDIFKGQPVDIAYQDREFAQLRHLNVPPLDDEELEQIRLASDRLALLIDRRTEHLDKLLRLPFNLRLLAELADSGLTVAQLTPIRTQIELLERYWLVRVLAPDHASGAAEIFLRPMVRRMAQSRSREYSRNLVAEIAAGPVINQLLKESVLVEFVTPSSGRVNSSVLAFSHHLIQDYAVARLLLRGAPADLCRELEQDPNIVFWIWVSLEMHFHYLWWYERQTFWETVFLLEASTQAPLLGKLVGPAVAADLIETPADFGPLLQNIRNGSGDARSAEAAFGHIVGRLSAQESRRRLVGENSPPWARLIAEISRL
jgi:hypothetical protein